MSPDEIRRWFEDNAGPDAGDAAERIVWKLLDEHKPIGIYEECGHSHHPEEPGVKDVNDVGLVCAEGLTYEVCASCCEWNPVSGQTEHCASEHDHHWGGTHCMVVYSISESLGVSSEDRSEPTPAPRTWPTTHTTEPDDVRMIRDDEGDRWEHGTDGLWHSYDDTIWKPLSWAQLMHQYGPLTEVPLSEVVTPEDPT